MPSAEKTENVRIVIRGVELSDANQLFPLPSGPAGQRMLLILLKPAAEDEGEPSTWAFSRGIGTRAEENGDAPDEKGTFGLLVPFKIASPLPKDVKKEPAKKRLASDEFVVIEVTFA